MKSSDNLIVKEANPPGILKDFIRLPYRLYRDNPHWVPPLLSEEKRMFNKKLSPFLKKNPVVLYVCYRDKTPVGRIAGIINQNHNNIHKDKAAFFGFFESIRDDSVAEQLFRAVSHWVKNVSLNCYKKMLINYLQINKQFCLTNYKNIKKIMNAMMI